MTTIKVKADETITLSPYGTVPIKDAKSDVNVLVEQHHILRGKREVPNGCAIALGIKEDEIARAIAERPSAFPGVFLGAWIYKTRTIIMSRIGGFIQARRYLHDAPTTRQVNGFDKTGDMEPGIVTLYAPRGDKRAGLKVVRPPDKRPRSGERRPGTCRKRGAFVDPLHAVIARKETGEKCV